eukprot:XP_001694798.1 DNA dependent protein kinase catalytic subunit [Chlamydomonas reinhardtii]
MNVTLPSAPPLVLLLLLLLPSLAKESPAPQARSAAAELLHAAALWVVGANAAVPEEGQGRRDYERRVTRFQPLLARLFPVVLRLAAGPEPLARELFRRLAGQLVHWYTRGARREGAEAMALLEAVLAGLTLQTLVLWLWKGCAGAGEAGAGAGSYWPPTFPTYEALVPWRDRDTANVVLAAALAPHVVGAAAADGDPLQTSAFLTAGRQDMGGGGGGHVLQSRLAAMFTRVAAAAWLGFPAANEHLAPANAGGGAAAVWGALLRQDPAFMLPTVLDEGAAGGAGAAGAERRKRLRKEQEAVRTLFEALNSDHTPRYTRLFLLKAVLHVEYRHQQARIAGTRRRYQAQAVAAVAAGAGRGSSSQRASQAVAAASGGGFSTTVFAVADQSRHNANHVITLMYFWRRAGVSLLGRELVPLLGRRLPQRQRCQGLRVARAALGYGQEEASALREATDGGRNWEAAVEVLLGLSQPPPLGHPPAAGPLAPELALRAGGVRDGWDSFQATGCYRTGELPDTLSLRLGESFLRPLAALAVQIGLHDTLEALAVAYGDLGESDELGPVAAAGLPVPERPQDLAPAGAGSWERCLGEVQSALARLRSRWAGLHPLSAAARVAALSLLQPLAEISEAVRQVLQPTAAAAAAAYGLPAGAPFAAAGRWHPPPRDRDARPGDGGRLGPGGPVLEGFIDALDAATYPAQRWQVFVSRIRGALQRGGLDAADVAPVLVTGFGRDVNVFGSKQRPKQMTMFCSDLRRRTWLSKGGQDVRLDERLQRLLLPAGPACVGVCGGASERECGFAGVRARHSPAAAGEHASLSAAGALPPCLLRSALLRSCGGGPELFLARRRRLASSLAAGAAAGYLAGVGDRHADNVLLQAATGELVHIDFGYSFGAGTQVVPIPELGQERQEGAEAEVEDSSSGSSSGSSGGLVLTDDAGTNSSEAPAAELARARVSTALQKLARRHPSLITADELRPVHGARPYYAALGLGPGVRSATPPGPLLGAGGAGGPLLLSPLLQARCLLEAATDPNLLARTYLGVSACETLLIREGCDCMARLEDVAAEAGHLELLRWLRQARRDQLLSTPPPQLLPERLLDQLLPRLEPIPTGAACSMLETVAQGCPLEALQRVNRRVFGTGMHLTASTKQSLAIAAAVSSTPDWEQKLDWVLQQQPHGAALPGHPNPAGPRGGNDSAVLRRGAGRLPDWLQRLQALRACSVPLPPLSGLAVWPAHMNDVAALTWLLAEQGEVAPVIDGVMYVAAAAGHVPVLTALQERGCVFSGRHVLAAARAGRTAAVSWLLAQPLQPPVDDWAEVFKCLARGGADLATLRQLHERHGARIDLEAVAKYGSVEALEWAVALLRWPDADVPGVPVRHGLLGRIAARWVWVGWERARLARRRVSNVGARCVWDHKMFGTTQWQEGTLSGEGQAPGSTLTK